MNTLIVTLARRPWIITAMAVVVAGVLVARIANHLLEASYLDDATHSPNVPVVAAPPPLSGRPSPRELAARADGLTSRNIFCSDCTAAAEPGPAVAVTEGDAVPVTTLPLVLVATSMDDDPSSSMATVRHTGSGAQGAFRVGQRLPGGGAIEKIAGTYLWFHNDAAAGRIERIDLNSVRIADVGPTVAAAAGGGPTAARADADKFADRVRKIDDVTYEVDRGLIGELVSGGGKVKGVRAMPVVANGKLTGVRMSVQPSSIGAAVGLRTGDVVKRLGGVGLTSPEELMAAYAKLGDARSVTVDLERAGKPVTVTYQLR